MKALGCLLAVVAAAVLGFFALAWFTFMNTDDHGALTKELEATVVDVDKNVAGPDTSHEYEYAIVYTYRVRRETFRGEIELPETLWGPKAPLTLCVNPDEPAEHVVNTEARPCGSESVGFEKISTSTPTSSPG